ncbi:MAG TPA: hypothetical protein VNI36_06725 [Candidatus Dormibacteraeota bacterium]|nr:hypothetical protein [Candidatus Dormibacteraeota bacterium]
MHRLCSACFVFVLGAALAAIYPLRLHGQDQFQFENDLVATRHVFGNVGAGFRAMRRGPKGNYYILTAPSPAVQIYNADGNRLGQVPSEAAATAKDAALVYGESMDVDAEGRVVVCDRGANAVKLYAPDGSLATTIPVSMPVSVVFLPGGEFAVASPDSEQLVTVYDLAGRVVREFGEREEISDQDDLNRQINFVHLVADESGNSYLAFDYIPEPTVRKFNHAGYLSLEISLKTLEFQPAAQAARKAIARSETGTVALHRIISAVGVDPKTQDIWMSIGTLLMHFDKNGQRLASFRTYMPEGGRWEPSTIVVEPDRLLMGADPQGIYEFPKPARLPQ